MKSRKYGEAVGSNMARSRTARLEHLAAAIGVCVQCPLWRSRHEAVPGEGPVGAPLFLVGEAPGRQEDRTGRPFVGPSGRVLASALEVAGLHREEVFITSSVKCRPPAPKKPKREEVATCTRLYLANQVEAVDPGCVVTLGNFGLQALLGWDKAVGKVHGEVLRYRQWPLVPTYHPAASFRNPRTKAWLEADLTKAAGIARGQGG